MNQTKNEPQTPVRGNASNQSQNKPNNTPATNQSKNAANQSNTNKQPFTPQNNNNKVANGNSNGRVNSSVKNQGNNSNASQSRDNSQGPNKSKPNPNNNKPKQGANNSQQQQQSSSQQHQQQSKPKPAANSAPNQSGSASNSQPVQKPHTESNASRAQNEADYNGPQSAAMNSATGAGSAANRPHFKVQLGQPTLELPPMDLEEKKFTGRCRIFVANLPANASEDQVRKLFEEYGQVSEVYLGKANFGFVKMDTRRNAELARAQLDGRTYEGRVLRVRLAAHAAAIRVKNLSPYVTNELLEYSFSYFGEVERAIVISDDRGRSIGEGIVEFSRKFSATNALKRCLNDCFLITGSPKPVYVEPFEQRDEDEGFPEKQLNKNAAEFRQEREVGPRFAEPGSFEHEYASRWKQLYELEKQKREALENEIQDARKMLAEQHEYARVEHQTKLLRNQLREMEDRADKFSQLRNNRMEDERRREEERQNQLLYMRQQEEQIIRRSQVQDFSSLRRQESDLRSKANALQDLLDKQDQAMRQGQAPVPSQPEPQGPMGYGAQMGGYGDSSVQQAPTQYPQHPYFSQMPPMVAGGHMQSGMEMNRGYPPSTIGPQPIGPYAPNAAQAQGYGVNRPYPGPPGPPTNGTRFNKTPEPNGGPMFNQAPGQPKRVRRF